MLERLWAQGPGSGPVAAHRGRTLLFAAPGTAQRLPSLLAWEEWGTGGARPGRTARALPPVLCHGTGDAVTVPPLTCDPTASGPQWVVAPDTRTPGCRGRTYCAGPVCGQPGARSSPVGLLDFSSCGSGC